MVADILTKPLQGEHFEILRDVIGSENKSSLILLTGENIGDMTSGS
jgi:hypothetical protein